MTTKEAKEVGEQQTTAVTQYLVQVKRIVNLGKAAFGEEGQEEEVWIELGRYEAPSGNRRKAIEQAMDEHGIEDGSFHTIPETSAGVETVHTKKTRVWD